MVTLILTRIVFVLSIPLCLYAVYFGVVALFGLRKKLPAAPQAKPEKRFALVVAARNEAAVIGQIQAQADAGAEYLDGNTAICGGEELAAMLSSLMQSPEGMAVMSRISESAKK